MIFNKTDLKDAWIIGLDKFADNRGFFARTYCDNEFREHGINLRIVQANISHNKTKHTLRGMHYQSKPYGESKLVQCIRGGIYDVIIDIRQNSPTFKKWIGVELNELNRQMLFVPKGFAHGFITLKDDTEITYQVSEFYTPDAERGIKYNDPAFNISWPEKPKIISEKDKKWPPFKG